MKRAFFLFLGFSFLSTYSTIAQTWTDQEMEVWQTVLDCMAAGNEMNETAINACFHEDYKFWSSDDILPFGKDLVRKYNSKFMDTFGDSVYDIRPVSIKVHGDAALVHWGFRGFDRDAGGSIQTGAERVSMMLVRENGRWVYFGGGRSYFEE